MEPVSLQFLVILAAAYTKSIHTIVLITAKLQNSQLVRQGLKTLNLNLGVHEHRVALPAT